MRAPRTKRGRRAAATATLAVRLLGHVQLEVRDGGVKAVVSVDGLTIDMGPLSAAAIKRVQALRTGLPLQALLAPASDVDREIARLVRRLAARGLVEYRLARARGGDLAIIEPQLPDYWPHPAPLHDSDRVVLSRFAYLRRRADAMVLESPRAGALFKIADTRIAAALAALVTPQRIRALRQRRDFPGLELLRLLLDCHIVLKVAAGDQGLRATEGNADLVLWDFHDLLFHARSTEGRHANPIGGVYPHVDVIEPLPAVRPRWPGEPIELRPLAATASQPTMPIAELLRQRHSTRDFGSARPITLGELARFLDGSARVLAIEQVPLDGEAGGPLLSHTVRPYPSGGADYPLELYLAVDNCEGLPRGFYHYDAGEHALVPIDVRVAALDALLAGAEFAMGTTGPPQILIYIAARFGRTSWKYSSLAYGLILKEVGVLMQTFYLLTTAMGLGGCAIGSGNIELFAKMTGLDFHVEGPVGQFALGRGAPAPAADAT